MQILVAQYAGACYGVNRALKLAREAAAQSSEVYTVGPLIHNPQVVNELSRNGIKVAGSMDEIPDGASMVIRSHGVTPDVSVEALARGMKVTDATCPHVSKAQKAAEDLQREGYTVVVVGEEGHPEVEGILAYAGADAIVVDSVDNLPEQLPGKVGVVVQTTQSEEALDAVVEALRPRVAELEVKNTICFATQQRQQSARELAAKADVMIVIGGRNSGNTRRLHEICSSVCPRSYHIEVSDEIDPAWFEGCETVGITAGASTPEVQIERVCSFLEQMQ